MRIGWYTFLLTASLSVSALIHVFPGQAQGLSQKWENALEGGKVTGEVKKALGAGKTAALAQTAAPGTEEALAQAAASGTEEALAQAAASRAEEALAQTAASGTEEAQPGAAAGSGEADSVAGEAVDSGSEASKAAAGKAADSTAAPKTAAGKGQAADPAAAPAAQPAPIPDSNLSGVLFIGDSRTVGLSEYGDLGNAEVFADSGMSVYHLLDARITMKGGNKLTLEQVLSQNHFSTIYLMLGINELGYDRQRTVAQYKTVVDKIRQMQPQAQLVLEANLHVTPEKSAKSSVYNNTNINALNQAIKQLADDSHLYYLDVNTLFDDKNGNMNPAYSSDGSHVLGKYYSMWADWIRKGGR